MKPKTIMGYLQAVDNLNDMTISDLKGFEKLSDKMKKIIIAMNAEVSNHLSEIEELLDIKPLHRSTNNTKRNGK